MTLDKASNPGELFSTAAIAAIAAAAVGGGREGAPGPSG